MSKFNILAQELRNRFLASAEEIYTLFVNPAEKRWLKERGYKARTYDDFKNSLEAITNDLFAMLHIIASRLSNDYIFNDLYYDVTDYYDFEDDYEIYDRYDFILKIDDHIYGVVVDDDYLNVDYLTVQKKIVFKEIAYLETIDTMRSEYEKRRTLI